VVGGPHTLGVRMLEPEDDDHGVMVDG
jgi:hypothetical protein